MPDLYSEVRFMKGVGEARAKKLAGLGIVTVYDLLRHFPRQYEDRTQLVPLAQLPEKTPVCFRAMVTAVPRASYGRSYQTITRVPVTDGHERITLTFFHRKGVAEQLLPGKIYIFYGALNERDGLRSVINPDFEPEEAPGQVTRRIVPVYPLAAGLSNTMLSRLIGQALAQYSAQLPETLPAALRAQRQLLPVQEAYRIIHNPPDFDRLAEAQRRLTFEELFVFSAGLSLMKSRRQTETAAAFSNLDIAPFTAALPFALTGAQQRAIDDILRDLARPVPMNRLVQGDVGSGKTMVAAAAAYCAAKNGWQTAFMAPTEILAEQHAQSLARLLEPLGVRVALLTGGMKAAAARQTRALIAQGMADLVIGTHALLSAGTEFARLGLVIADEQHRFGVGQRAALTEKGQFPHVLVMSATPIPRTLALILYGDLDVSVIDELPPGRQTIDTFLVGERMRQRVNAFIRRQVAEGHQVYIVCPAVEEREIDDLKAAEVWAQTLQQAVFPDLRVALLHGKMKPVDKEAVMRRFAAGESDILVATTVIEVGVDVPNATLIVIENAERFGLSQLHQLRGRVGRGSAKSCCILFSSHSSAQTQERLKAFCATNDGFRIAEEDLRLRGPGDFFGSRQSGLPAFRSVNLAQNLDVMEQARQAADAYVSQPDSGPEWETLNRRIRTLFDSSTGTFN